VDDYVKRADVLALQTEIRFPPIGVLKNYRCEHIDPVFVMTLPAADVRENVHGEWKHGREISRTMLMNNTLHIDYKNWKCSVCGFEVDRLLYKIDGSPVFNFCPNCGADMRGEQNG